MLAKRKRGTQVARSSAGKRAVARVKAETARVCNSVAWWRSEAGDDNDGGDANGEGDGDEDDVDTDAADDDDNNEEGSLEGVDASSIVAARCRAEKASSWSIRYGASTTRRIAMLTMKGVWPRAMMQSPILVEA